MLEVFFKAHVVVGRINFLVSIDLMVACLFKISNRLSKYLSVKAWTLF